jgi:hypothetical protein
MCKMPELIGVGGAGEQVAAYHHRSGLHANYQVSFFFLLPVGPVSTSNAAERAHVACSPCIRPLGTFVCAFCASVATLALEEAAQMRRCRPAA